MGNSPKKSTGKLPSLSFTSDRRFGAELELLAFDGKNRPEQGQRPKGIDYVAMIVQQSVPEKVEIREWEHTNNNDSWVIKPDSSCGMEICTPILKGWSGLKKVCDVVLALSKDEQIKIDDRCSVHLHVEVADLDQNELASVIAHWLKIEAIIMDAMPPQRKRNRYCQFMGMTNLVQHDQNMAPQELIKRVGQQKYYSSNTNQMIRNGRKTIEFRTIEGAGVKDPYLIKNWVRFIIHFVEMSRKRQIPPPYDMSDEWSSFVWLDVEDVLKLLGFNNNPHQYDLSNGLEQTRNWFLARLQKYMSKDVETGPRHYAYKDLQAVLDRFREEGVNIVPEEHLTPTDLVGCLYSEDTKS